MPCALLVPYLYLCAYLLFEIPFSSCRNSTYPSAQTLPLPELYNGCLSLRNVCNCLSLGFHIC